MINTLAQQFFSQLSKAKKILIALPPRPTADTAGTASALALFLKKLDKDVEIACEDNFDERFGFLPKTGVIKNALSSALSFAVVVNTSQHALEEISYQQEPGKAKIFLKSANGLFTPEDISFETQTVPYGLAIILGCQTLEDLGKIFETQPDLFFDTPKVNIDNRADNQDFGSINLVDINSTSLAELVTQLLQDFETNLLDEDIATALLAGIMQKTRSFQHPQVSPKSFLKASELISLGARQQEIVKALFKTKPLALLKLWGRALARLNDMDTQAVAALSSADFLKSGAELSLLPLVLKELLENLNGKMAVAVLAENGPNVKILLALKTGVDQVALQKILGQAKEYKNLELTAFSVLEYDWENLSLVEAQQRLEAALTQVLKS